jgi:hypothetical protein
MCRDRIWFYIFGPKTSLIWGLIFFCEWVIKSEVNMRECLYVEHKTKERLKLMK